MMTTTQTAAEFLASLEPALDAHQVSCNEIRKRIRTELAAAVKAGAIPAGTKFSVRGDHNSIDVEITAWNGCPLSAEYIAIVMDDACGRSQGMREWADRPRRAPGARLGLIDYCDAVNAALALAEQITGRHNFDESRIEVDYFHCGYYQSVSASGIAAIAERGIREEMTPALTAKRQQARIAAARLGAGATRSICGRAGIDGCSEWALDRLLKLDARAAGRPVAYDRRGRRWAVDDAASALCNTREAA